MLGSAGADSEVDEAVLRALLRAADPDAMLETIFSQGFDAGEITDEE